MSVINNSYDSNWNYKLILKIMLLTILSIVLIMVSLFVFLLWYYNRPVYVEPFFKISEVDDIALMKKDTTNNWKVCYLEKDTVLKLSNHKDTIWVAFVFKLTFLDTCKIKLKNSMEDEPGYKGTLDKVSNINVYLNNQNITDKLFGYKRFNRNPSKFCNTYFSYWKAGIFENMDEFIEKLNTHPHPYDQDIDFTFYGVRRNGQISFFCMKKDLGEIQDTMQLKFEMKFSDGRIIGREIEIYK